MLHGRLATDSVSSFVPIAVVQLTSLRMYDTEGVESIATITELRSETADLISHARESKNGILIQKNNEPHAVLIDWDVYKTVKEKLGVDSLSDMEEV